MKIAIIGQTGHEYIGGIESYINQLLLFFKKNHIEVVEYVTHPKKFYKYRDIVRPRVKEVKLVNIASKTMIYPFKAVHKIKKIIKSNQFDLIIHNSEPAVNDWMLKQKNVVFVQHQEFKSKNKESKSKSEKFKLALDRIFLGLGYKGNFLNKGQKVVLFAREESASTAPVTFYIPTFSGIPQKLNLKNHNKVLWIGRLTKEKGAHKLSQINQMLKNKIVIYGDGECREQVEASKVNYKGLAMVKDLPQIYDSAKVHIITSQSEGFGLTIVEALSRGVPVVALNRYKALQFFVKSGAVFLADNLKQLAAKTNEIMSLTPDQWAIYAKKAYAFAKQHFSIANFEKKWEEVLKTCSK